VSKPGPEIVVVSGLSGSGKSTAMAALEDVGFYCVDNLPPMLMEQFLDLCSKSTAPVERIALAIDAREKSFLSGLPQMIENLREQSAQIRILFLECSNEILVNRYRETRRVHPLAPTGNVEEGVETERRLLGEVAALADFALDTSELNVHQLKDAVIRDVSGKEHTTVINLNSFGFRFGTPQAAELLFDVRFLPNPYFEPGLKARTGLEAEVAKYVLEASEAKAFLEHLDRLLLFLMPLYDAEGKAYLSIGIGCTGGRHRSVAVAEAIAKRLSAAGHQVNLTHRDVEKEE
jgi:UPF0042 nucleotide-binding protein